MATLDISVRDTAGEVTGALTLDGDIFGIEANIPLLHQVVTAQLAAARAGTQSTKTRAEVSGGGKKPFKQKGTGRARQGSERAPHFTGGGVALGPKPRSYRQRTPRKMIQLALRCALSDRASEGKVAVVDAWPWTTPSTKAALSALGALELEGRVLIVVPRDADDAKRSFRNLPDVQLIDVGELNAYDVLCNDWIVFTPETLPGSSEIVAAPPAATPAAKKRAAKKPAVEDKVVEDTVVEDTPVEGAAAEDTAAEDTAAEDTAVDDDEPAVAELADDEEETL